MNLIEAYSLTAAQKISKPFVLEKFFPLGIEKYIVFSPFSKNSKNYDWYQNVIDIIYPVLEKNNIKIVQIGAQGEMSFSRCINTQGATNLNQACFLIKNSLLYFGSDSFGGHVAGSYNKPLVVLVSNNYICSVSPYFGDEKKHIILEPPCRKEGIKPSFSYDEGVGIKKQINQILPEDVAKSILSLLGLEYDFSYKTIYFGSFYNSKVFETSAGQVVDLRSIGGIDSIIVRMDYEFNEQNLFLQAGHCVITIVTDKPINLDILSQIRPRIKQLVYIIDKNHDINWIKKIQKLAIPYILITYETKEWLDTIKLDYLDIGLIHKKEKNDFEYIEKTKNISKSSLYFRSNKFTLARGKIYQSQSHYKKDMSISSLESEILPILDDDDFYKEIEHFYVLEKV